MRCPFCKQDSDKVIDSRASEEGCAIRRRRECLACNRRYTTYERVEEFPLRVVKKNGELTSFDRSKILAGVIRACEKRPVTMAQMERVVGEIESRIFSQYDKEVQSRVVGEMVMEKLRQLDQVAYVRFASVYREFKDVSDFVDEVKPMLSADREKKQGTAP